MDTYVIVTKRNIFAIIGLFKWIESKMVWKALGHFYEFRIVKVIPDRIVMEVDVKEGMILNICMIGGKRWFLSCTKKE